LSLEQSDYQYIPAGSTDTVLGAGRKGDILKRVILIPVGFPPGTVKIKDGSGSARDLYAAFTTGIGTLVSETTPRQMDIEQRSVLGGWKITTGAGSAALAIGKF